MVWTTELLHRRWENLDMGMGEWESHNTTRPLPSLPHSLVHHFTEEPVCQLLDPPSNVIELEHQ